MPMRRASSAFLEKKVREEKNSQPRPPLLSSLFLSLLLSLFSLLPLSSLSLSLSQLHR